WVHLRAWKPKTLTAAPGRSTDWVEVGSLLDTLNDGQWLLSAKGTGGPGGRLRYALEVGVRNAHGKIRTIPHLKGLARDVALAYDADTRYSRRIRLQEQVLYDLVDYLKKQPVRGVAPKRTLIYGYTFDPRPGDAKYTAPLEEFLRLAGPTALNRSSGQPI